MAKVRVQKCRKWGYLIYPLDFGPDDVHHWRPTWAMAVKKANKMIRVEVETPWHVDFDSEKLL